MLAPFDPSEPNILRDLSDVFDLDRSPKLDLPASRVDNDSFSPLRSDPFVGRGQTDSFVAVAELNKSEYETPFSRVDAFTAVATARYAASLETFTNDAVTLEVEQGIFPRIVINDAIGPQGSRDYALPFDAVVSLGGCTGTLIAPNVVIAARHCGSPSQVTFGANSGSPTLTVSVANVIFPAGGGSLLDGGDLSLIFLTDSVPANIALPMQLTDETDALEGEEVAMIGFGYNGVGSQGHGFSADGMRWGGTNILDEYGVPAGANGENILSTDFDNGSAAANTIAGSDPNPLQYEATTAPGDSGGPLMVNRGGEWVIAGVLSGGTSPTSVYGDISWWTGVAPFRAEIENAGGTFYDGTDPGVDDHSDLLDGSATPIEFDSFPIARGEGRIGTIGDRDVFSFDLLNRARAIFDGVAIGNFDPYVRLYDVNGVLLGENNDRSGSLDSQFRMDLEAGKYYVSVGSNGDLLTGQYRVAVRHNGPSDDHGQRFSNATNLAMQTEGNTVETAVADRGSDIDMFRFIADRSGELVLRTKALSGDLNTVLRVWNENRTMIAVNNNWNGQLDSRASINITSGQQYYAHVDTIGQTSGDYRLFLIPQSESDDRGRATFDLNLPAHENQLAAFDGRNLSLDSYANSPLINQLASADFARIDQYGPQPLNVLANGLG